MQPVLYLLREALCSGFDNEGPKQSEALPQKSLHSKEEHRCSTSSHTSKFNDRKAQVGRIWRKVQFRLGDALGEVSMRKSLTEAEI